MWELTSTRGLNWAVDGERTAFLKSLDTRLGTVVDAYGFDVGQPLANPPAHPAHRDVGLSPVRRILSFRSRHELAFAFRLGGFDWVLEIDARRNLCMTLHGPEHGGRVRHKIVCGKDEIGIGPGESVEIGESLRSFRAERPAPEAVLTTEEALRQAVLGNTVRAPSGALYVPVNRAWIAMFGRLFAQGEGFCGPLTFIWDAAFGSLLASRFDTELALSNLRLLFEQCEPDGFFRQLRVGELKNNLSNLPLVSHAVMALYERTGAREILAEFYPRLFAFNRWLLASRDKNGDGLLEWGYEAQGRGIELTGPYAPHYESGLDDSPMWQDEPFDEGARAMATSAVCLNSIAAYDCLLLARMAAVLERPDDAAALRASHARLKDLVNRHLWDESRQIYANRRWSGEFSPELSPTSFFPLLAEIPDAARARSLLRHLEDEALFGGEHRLPSIARSSRHFTASGDYWRGRVWPPLNHLVLQGLKKYDEAAARSLAEASRRLFMKEWLAHGHVHENYCADSGWGEAPAGVYYRSCPFYTWGALLLLP